MRNLAVLAVALLVLGAGCSGSSEPETKDIEPALGQATDAPSSSDTANSDATADLTAAVSFKDVQAVLTASCVACHGGPGAKERLDMSSYDSLMKGSEHGVVVAAGDPDGSLIVKALRGKGAKQMPMMADPLPEPTIAKVEAWIKAGAKNE